MQSAVIEMDIEAQPERPVAFVEKIVHGHKAETFD